MRVAWPTCSMLFWCAFLGAFSSTMGCIDKAAADTITAADGSNLPAVDDHSWLVIDLSPIPGDANQDGTVDADDLNIVLTNYNKPGDFAMGDFNNDGKVDLTDLELLVGNFHCTSKSGGSVSGAQLDSQAIGMLQGAGIKVVPEPGTIVLLPAGLIGLLAYAWRKRS
jgi:PEP-CTERM motif